MAQKLVHEIAQSFDLFGEYVDPDATVSREKFDAMSIEEREALIMETFSGNDDVAFENRCPYCGALDTDDLVFNDDDTVTCQICGTSYSLL